MSTSPDQWNTALRAVLTKSTADADFRAKCLSEPVAAVLEETGFQAPADLRFVEETDGAGIVLPPFAGNLDEITDAEVLGEVSGGLSTRNCVSINEQRNNPNYTGTCNW